MSGYVDRVDRVNRNLIAITGILEEALPILCAIKAELKKPGVISVNYADIYQAVGALQSYLLGEADEAKPPKLHKARQLYRTWQYFRIAVDAADRSYDLLSDVRMLDSIKDARSDIESILDY